MGAGLARVQRADLHRPDRRGRHCGSGFLAGELQRPENADITRQLDAAISRGLRPTTLIHRVQPHSDWEEIDFLLLDAFHVWKSEQSGTTGYPLWLTRSQDPNLAWGVLEVEDMADRALEEWDEANAGKKRKKGVTRVAVPVMEKGHEDELTGGLARRHHYESMAKFTDLEHGASEDDEDGLEIERHRPPGGYDASQYG